MTTIAELEERLKRPEIEVEALKKVGIVVGKKPWWEEISGVFKDSAEFEEAMRLGQEWREAQRIQYDEAIEPRAEDTRRSA